MTYEPEQQPAPQSVQIPAAEMTDEQYQAELERIFDEYRERSFREHLVGPIISFFFHIVLVTGMILLMREEPYASVPEIEISLKDIKIKELEEPLIEEIDQIDEEMTDDVPQVMVSMPAAAPLKIESTLDDFSDDVPETDDTLELEQVLDVLPKTAPVRIPLSLSGRTEHGRKSMVRRKGGSTQGQNAVLKALRWLKKVQNSDGSWAGGPAFTATALLCFLAHGETPLSENFGVTVQKAMQWLAGAMPAAGECGGRAYSHGMATYALAEAYGMTQIPFLLEPMENGLRHIVQGQQAGGGFDYHYAKTLRWDMSVSGWQFQAMKAAYVAGAQVEGLEEAMNKAVKFCRKIAYANNNFGYSSPGSGGNMTGVGTVGMQLLGAGHAKEVEGACQTIATVRLQGYQWANASINLYGWYYDTQAMFNKGGNSWRDWNAVFEKELVYNQHPEGYWETKEGHGMGPELAGKVFSTTLSCLQLEVYYRYLPTFDIRRMAKKTARKGIMDLGDDDELIIE